MKHLIALARKYLQRQKLRTMLSFLCIMLSVFVFNLFIMASILIRSVALGSLSDSFGLWHMDLASWVEKMPEPDKVNEIIPNHVAVDDYLILHRSNAEGVNRYDTRTAYFMTLSVNDVSVNVLSLRQIRAQGNASYAPHQMWILSSDADFAALAPDEIILPISFQEQGFRVGDVVTISVTPNRSTLVEDTDQIRPYIEEMLADVPEKEGLPWFADSPGAEEAGSSILGPKLLDFLVNNGLLTDAEFTDHISGEPLTVSMRIAGFNKGYDGYYGQTTVITSLDSKLDVTQALQGEFAPAPEEDMTVSTVSYRDVYVTLTDKIDFDDAAEMLYRDLGMPEEKMLELVHPAGENASQLYNLKVLALEFRGADVITTWLTTLLPAVIAFIVLVFVFWALMRFVIDNAFEISVQERRAQFSTLRIMGASRRQIALLVCMEALAYSAAAIPFGLLAAYGCKHMIVSALEKVNIAVIDNSMPLVTCIGVILALAAIFISAYTSSMWAARAYGPLEATKRADLKGNKRETIWNINLLGKTHKQKFNETTERIKQQSGDLKVPRKAKLNRRRSGFLLHYTMRNIRRTRKRFIISVITMTLGCGLFSFGVSAAGCLIMEISSRNTLPYRDSDFQISFGGRFQKEILDDIEAKFERNPNYSEWNVSVSGPSEFQSASFVTVVNELLPNDYADWFMREFNVEDREIFYNSMEIVPRRKYEQNYEKTTGFSYDEFVDSNCGILCYSAYGSAAAYRGEEVTAKLYETGFTAAKGEPPVLIEECGDRIPMLGALATESPYQSLVIMIPADNAETLLQTHMTAPLSKNSSPAHVHIRLTVAGTSKYEAARDELSDYVSHLTERFGGDTMLQDEFVENTGLKYVLLAIGSICLIALCAVWGVGIFTMLNTINTGVLNRCDELMMLRMIGMSQKQMRETVSLESVIYCSISTVIGGILGIAACLYLVMETFFDVTPTATFAILFLSLLLTLLVNTLIARIAAKPGLRALHQRLEAGKMMQ